MNIILLHGDHTLKSLQRLQKFIQVAKKRGWEIQRIDPDSPFNLSEILTSGTFFATNRLFILEQINKIRRKEFEWLSKKAPKLSGDLVIYSQGLVSKNTLKLLPKGTKVEEFKLPKLIWQFLDSFYPGNAKKCLKLLHQVIKQEPKEFVFALLGRHLRDMYWVTLGKNKIPYAQWRVSKLSRQAKTFPKGKLEKLIKLLADLDYRIKTSKEEIVDSLDFIILSELE